MAADTVQLSQQYKSLIEDKNVTLAALDAEEVIQDDPKLLIFKKMIESLTGRTIQICTGPVADEFPQITTANETSDTAELTNQKFAFDLNADGVNDNMPFVTGGSGILVFDKNSDQTVNDGSELFGPQTGNGFQELAAFDQTNDGWIDENDGSYSQLYVWTKDVNGNDYLRSLKESGVGALYIPAVETSFDLKNSENETEGRIQRTGIYLSESGQVGTVQQIDVAV